MEENLTARSFIVRIYRADTEDTGKITGLVEALDGSGSQAPFRDAGELAGLLQSGAGTARKRVRKAKGERTRKTAGIKQARRAEG
jgi:hypothetical protein